MTHDILTVRFIDTDVQNHIDDMNLNLKRQLGWHDFFRKIQRFRT